MNDNLFEFYFEGRKPSEKQVKAIVIKALKQGYGKINISWGENMIEIERAGNNQVYGHGWIRDISGQDMATDIQRKAA